MSAVEVPAELVGVLKMLADRVERVVMDLSGFSIGDELGIRLDGVVAELRALLPQPAPTCPLCGRVPNAHGIGLTEGSDLCPLPSHEVARAAEMVTERDSKPAPAPGSVESFTAHVQALGADFDAVRRAAQSGGAS